jgi:hypothetical protein
MSATMNGISAEPDISASIGHSSEANTNVSAEPLIRN